MVFFWSSTANLVLILSSNNLSLIFLAKKALQLQNRSSHSYCTQNCWITWFILWAVSNLDHTVSNGRIIDEWWTGNYFKGSSHGLIKVLSWHLPRGTEETVKKPPIRIAYDLANIWTRHLPNTSTQICSVLFNHAVSWSIRCQFSSSLISVVAQKHCTGYLSELMFHGLFFKKREGFTDSCTYRNSQPPSEQVNTSKVNIVFTVHFQLRYVQ
jgi:hypothetical protein